MGAGGSPQPGRTVETGDDLRIKLTKIPLVGASMVTVFGSFGVLVSSSVQHFLWPVLQASLRLLILLVGTKHDQTKKNNKHTTVQLFLFILIGMLHDYGTDLLCAHAGTGKEQTRRTKISSPPTHNLIAETPYSRTLCPVVKLSK
jgi:hypothetical protein